MNRLHFYFLKFSLFSPRGFLTVLLSALIYAWIAITLINIRNIASFAFSEYSLLGKIKILSALFWGALQTVSVLDQVLLVATALLFGISMAVVLKRLEYVRKGKSTRVVVGTGILSLASTGCASCGLSLFSLVGLAGAVGALPFGGVEFYVLAITILLISLWYNLRGLAKECKL